MFFNQIANKCLGKGQRHSPATITLSVTPRKHNFPTFMFSNLKQSPSWQHNRGNFDISH